MNSKKDKVLILDCGAPQILGMAECLKKTGYQVDALSCSDGTYGYHSNLLDNKYLCPTLEPKLALSKLLQMPFESIDDYINNYKEINGLLEKLSFETKLERTKRRDLLYTDEEFFDYFGNFETDEVYGMLFARPITEKGTEFWVR